MSEDARLEIALYWKGHKFAKTEIVKKTELEDSVLMPDYLLSIRYDDMKNDLLDKAFGDDCV